MPQEFSGFVDQSHRLLRTNWTSPTALAEELYAMLLAPEGETPPERVQVPEDVQDRLRQAQERITPGAM
jgi:hypothetical protein